MNVKIIVLGFCICYAGEMQLNSAAVKKMYHEIACSKAGIISKKFNCESNQEYKRHLQEIEKCPLRVIQRLSKRQNDSLKIEEETLYMYCISYDNKLWTMYVPSK